jgi:hypothetical protein
VDVVSPLEDVATIANGVAVPLTTTPKRPAFAGVTLFTGKVELGGGVQTGLGQMTAEELDVPFSSVTVVMGNTTSTPDQL